MTPGNRRHEPTPGAKRSFDAKLAQMAQWLTTSRDGGATTPRSNGNGTSGREPLELDLQDPGQRFFDDFELLERIGQGGMGAVYRARQISLDREVAVKLLSAGPWASQEFIAGFKREAQNAAGLHHPNIVGVYAIGEQEGLIYYAMELIVGEALDHHLAGVHGMATRDAAALVRTIAEAVDYAHRLGVLHLDLKPANVLLDGHGTPKISDFGLARQLGEALSVQNERVSGTPSYMAPEQAAAHKGVLTPATDVWGLGTILYECITGTPPFAAETAEGTLRLVREGKVRRLSRTASVPHDLEAICLKCLARSPLQRYISARALADDLGRFIEGRPVRARPLHVWQRFGHWMQRDPRLAFAVGAVALALIAGIAATSLQWQRAERSAASAREVSRFISEDLLAAADPSRGDQNVAAMLAKAEARLDGGFAEQPETRAQIGLSIGRAYIGQGHWHRARLRMQRTYADANRSLGPLHALTLDTGEYLALALTYDAKYSEAEEVYRRVLPALIERAGATDPKVMRARRSHAMMLYETDQFEPAVEELRALRADALSSAPAMLPDIDATLGDLYTETNRWDEALALLQGALARSRERLGADHPEYLWQEMSLGDMLMMRGQWDEADAIFSNIHEGLVDTLGDSHPRTLTAIHYLGLTRLMRGQPGKALPLLQHALRERLRVQGPDHNWTHYSMNRVAEALVDLDRTDEAIPLLQQALQAVDRNGRRRQAYVILILDTFGQAYLKRGQPDRAQPYLLEGWRLARDTLPAHNVRRGIIERSMGELRASQHRYEEARGHYAVAETIFAEGWGKAHPWARAVRAQLAALPSPAYPDADRTGQRAGSASGGMRSLAWPP